MTLALHIHLSKPLRFFFLFSVEIKKSVASFVRENTLHVFFLSYFLKDENKKSENLFMQSKKNKNLYEVNLSGSHNMNLTQRKGIAGYVPPGQKPGRMFFRQFEPHFYVPPRLRRVNADLISSVNDYHYAMINDFGRNDFYYKLLREHIIPGETKVLEIGAGSGLLSMLASSLGAQWVLAVEGSSDLCNLARKNVAANGMTKNVHILFKMSTELSLSDFPSHQPADILVSELFGTLLLGESALDYIHDIRTRGLLASNFKILPRFGTQYAALIDCPFLLSITTAKQYRGLNLANINDLRDTSSIIFTKQYGFRLNSIPFKILSEPIRIFTVDFTQNYPGWIPKHFFKRGTMMECGEVHAIVLYWEVYDYIKGSKLSLSTHPHETKDNFPRDMQWGQALQLIEVREEKGVLKKKKSTTRPFFCVQQGKSVNLEIKTTSDSAVLQFLAHPIHSSVLNVKNSDDSSHHI